MYASRSACGYIKSNKYWSTYSYTDPQSNILLHVIREFHSIKLICRNQTWKMPIQPIRIVFLLIIACFHYTLLPSPRDKLELLGQILIKWNIRYWLNTSLFNFDTHRGLTVKIDIILVCTQQRWALHIFDVSIYHTSE